MDSADGPKALSGVTVVDLPHVQSGPVCTQFLAWLGADVIKVEPPGRGDVTRVQLRDVPDVDSLYFTMLNANKRSLTLDLKTDGGKEVFTRLVARADVLAENFAPGPWTAWGSPGRGSRGSTPVSSTPPSRVSGRGASPPPRPTRPSPRPWAGP